MPKIKTSRKKFPKGWDTISETLDSFDIKMREAENDSHDGKRKQEANWPIFRIHHQRSRYIYETFYKSKEISRELYEFCLNEGYADKNLIAKWKKQGYERLCCLKCVQDQNHVCICRVPRKPKTGLDKERIIECISCGCKGCASGDSNVGTTSSDNEDNDDDNNNNDNDNDDNDNDNKEDNQKEDNEEED